MPQPDRDPRTEPRAGDVLSNRGNTRRVLIREPYAGPPTNGLVVWEGDGISRESYLWQWKRWAKTAKVVQRGTD